MSRSSSELSNTGSGGSQRRSYTEEYRRDVVRLVTDQGYSIPAAARACGASGQTVRNWLGRYSASVNSSTGGDSVEELRAEVTRLRKELKRAELERAILEKATAYFAKDSR